MTNSDISNGFSLVEILISLFVVSLAAVNITVLQKVVGDQSRDNFSHVTVIALVSDKFEELMQYEQLQHVMDLDGTSSSINSRGTKFDFKWTITKLADTTNLSPIRSVSIAVTWLDTAGSRQTYIHSEQLSFAMLLKGAGLQRGLRTIVPNLLSNAQVNYFEPRMGYKMGAYVIYNSQLFQATYVHSVGNGDARVIAPPIDKHGVVANGWEKLGRIDNKALADLFTD